MRIITIAKIYKHVTVRRLEMGLCGNRSCLCGVAVFLFSLLCVSVLSFAEGFTAETIGNYGEVTVMEVEGNYDAPTNDCVECEFPRRVIANEFYRTHPDDYDFLVVASNFDFQMPIYEIAGKPVVADGFYNPVRNDVQGIGKDLFDRSSYYGSSGKLRGTIDIGPLHDKATDPLDPRFSWTMTVLSHEILHCWAASVNFIDSTGSVSDALLGSADVHWSYLFDTGGSVLYGNKWQNNKDGTFTSLPGLKYYSPLDLYLMGLVDKSEVPPMLLIENPDINPDKLSETGAMITGTAKTVTIDDIIAAEGERVPSVENSPKSFKVGAILIVRPGTYKEIDMLRMRTVIRNWVLWFSALTDGRARVVPDVAPVQNIPSNPGVAPPAYDPREEPVMVGDAVKWLIDNQEEDGRWIDSYWTDQRDTVITLWALKHFPVADSSRAGGIQWVSGTIPGNVDYIAKKICVLADNGDDYSELLDELIAKQNNDGGWGMDAVFGSNPLDTSLVLMALSTIDYSDQGVLDAAVSYLKQARNSDNGWGSTKGISDIRTTTDVLTAFIAYNQTYSLESYIQDGASWLYNRQNPDGGFGNSPSTIYDTAMSLLLLKSIGNSPDDVVTNALTYLINLQSKDGSWYESPYQTALAVNTLWAWQAKVGQDLWVSPDDITITPAVLETTPADVLVRASVHNNGLFGDIQAIVRLYDGYISESTMLGEQNVIVPKGGAIPVEFTVNVADGTPHKYIIFADPDNQVEEPDEANNFAYQTLENNSCHGPELKIEYSDVSLTPERIRTLPAVHTVDAIVHNIGDGDTQPFKVSLYKNAPGEGNKVAEQTISVARNSSTAVTFNLEVTRGDAQYLYISVDSDDDVAECNENNNLALKILHPEDTRDFEILDTDVTVSPVVTDFGQSITISAAIRNKGAGNAYNVPVKYYINGEEIGAATVNLDAGATVTKEFVWVTDKYGDNLTVSVKVDPDDLFDELVEDNNTGTATVTVNPLTIPNLFLSHENVVITPDPALEAGSAQVSAVVGNNGFVPIQNVVVSAWLDAPGDGGALIGSIQLASLDNGESRTVVIPWPVIDVWGEKRIYITAFSTDGVEEVREDDNVAFAKIDILSLPDLAVSSGSILFDPAVAREGDPLTIRVTVQNAGEQEAGNVSVRLYEDGRQVYEDTVSSIPGASSGYITFSCDTAEKTGTHEIRAVVDEEDTVLEGNEHNNTASGSFAVHNADLYVSEPYLSPNGDGIKDSTTLFFKLSSPSTVAIRILNPEREPVRSFSGSDLENTSGGSFTWDGLNEKGMVVPDGQYRIQVVRDDGTVVDEITVVVDNNRSSIADAISTGGPGTQQNSPAGSDSLLYSNLTCALPNVSGEFQWFSDESGILFNIFNNSSSEYPEGLYTMSPDGDDILCLTPWEWRVDPGRSYDYRGYSLSPNEEKILLVADVNDPDTGGLLGREIWSVDRYGQNPNNLLADDDPENGSIFQPLFSFDNSCVSYVRRTGSTYPYHHSLYMLGTDGSEPLLVDESETVFENMKWHPSAPVLAYVRSNPDGSKSIMAARPQGTAEELTVTDSAVESMEWLGNGRLLVVERDGNGYESSPRYSIRLVDATGGGNHITVAGNIEAADFGSVNWKAKAVKNPRNDSFAFIDNSGEGWQLKVCDAGGGCRVLYDAAPHSLSYIQETGVAVVLDDPAWSPDGSRLALVEYDEAASGDWSPYLSFNGDIVVIDIVSGEKTTYELFRNNNGFIPYLASFYISMSDGDSWETCGALHFESEPDIRTLDMTSMLSTAGMLTLKVEQKGLDEAYLGLVGLRIDDQYYWPDSAVNKATGEDIRSGVVSYAKALDNMVEAHGAVFEFTWSHLPASFGKAELVMAASEIEYSYHSETLQWLTGNDLIYNGSIGEAGGGGWPRINTLVLDLDTGKQARLPLDNEGSNHSGLSPMGTFITYERQPDPDSACYGSGSIDTWSVSSLLNMTAILHVLTTESAVVISGTADDLNFDRYVLEYENSETPGQWCLITPPSNLPVVNDRFIQWVPPGKGIYTIRLTVFDKAGNMMQKRRRVAWGYRTSIANLYTTTVHFTDAGPEFFGTGDYISPYTKSSHNALALHYQVLEPVNLEFTVLDSTGNVVRNLYQQHPIVNEPPLDAYVLWDGKDNKGDIVPDGKYSIGCLSYEFPVTVDRSSPQVTIKLDLEYRMAERQQDGFWYPGGIEFFLNGCGRLDKCNFVSGDMKAGAWDLNMLKRRIECRSMDTPDQWAEYTGFQNDAERLAYGLTLEELVKSDFVGKQVRITAEDQAGNRAFASGELFEAEDEKLILDKIEISPDVLNDLETISQQFSWHSDEDCSCGYPSYHSVSNVLSDESAPVPEIFLKPGTHRIRCFETVHAPIQKATLQYSLTTDPSLWIDGPFKTDPDPGILDFEWDTSSVHFPEKIYGIRVKAIDDNGIVHFSNIVPLVPYMLLGESCTGFQYHTLGFQGEEMVRLTVQVKKNYNLEDSDGSTEWYGIVYDAAQGDVVPGEHTAIPYSDILNRFALNPDPRFWPGYGEDENYEIRMVGETRSGKLCRSLNYIVYPSCNTPALSLYAYSHYQPGDCNQVSSRVRLSAGFDKEDIDDGLVNLNLVKSVSFYLVDETSDGVDGNGETLRLLSRIDCSGNREKWERETMPTGSGGRGGVDVLSVGAWVETGQLPEKAYKIKAVCEYGDSLLESEGSLLVDRVMPLADITSPGDSGHICPVREENDCFLYIEGIAEDNNSVEQYSLYFCRGETPGNWEEALALKHDPAPMVGKFRWPSGSVNGEYVNPPGRGVLGKWSVNELESGEYFLKLLVTDMAGNTTCHTTGPFYLDMGTGILAEAMPLLLSPNGDGRADSGEVWFRTDEPSTVDILLSRDGSYVDTLLAGRSHPGGQETLQWSPTSGLADGVYTLEFKSRDSCGNTDAKMVDIEIDNTRPNVEIMSPVPGEPLGIIVNIFGTADDANFLSYSLYARSVDDPTVTIPIAEGENPVFAAPSGTPGHLGTWNTFGLEGSWELVLSAQDKVENRNETITTVDLGDRIAIIRDLKRTPGLISPNNDGRLDDCLVSYELNPDLNESFDVTIRILDAHDTVLKAETQSSLSGGTHQYTWDGRTDAGDVVPDGRYTIELIVAISSNALATQAESIPVFVDTTPPVIDITRPLSEDCFKSAIELTGTIADENMREYAITCTGEAGTVYEEQGRQNREAYTFTTFYNLEEGAYTLNINAKDRGENSSETTITFLIDKTAPEVTLDTPREGDLFGAENSTVSVSGSIGEENLASWELRYGAGKDPAQWTGLAAGNTLPARDQLFEWFTGQGSGITDGAYTLLLQATDRAGWVSEARATLYIDNTPPVVEVMSPQQDGYVTEILEIAGTVFDPDFDTYSIDISSGGCAEGKTRWSTIFSGDAPVNDGLLYRLGELPSDGNYCVRVTATDFMGNRTQETVNFVIDTTPPAPPVLSGKVENGSDGALLWNPNSEPDLAGYNLYRDGMKIHTAPATTTGYLEADLPEGLYTYTLTAVDRAGLESRPSSAVKLRVDASGPSARIVFPGDGSVINDLAEIRGTAYSVDDFKEYRLFFGEGVEPATWTLIRKSPLPVSYGVLATNGTMLADGMTYSLRLETEDIYGNTGMHQVTFSVDSVPPAAPVLLSAVLDGSDVAVTWEPNPGQDIAGYLLYRNNRLVTASGTVPDDLKPYLVSGDSYTDASLPDGTFAYFLEAMDLAGNISAGSNIVEVSIDTHPPHALITAPSNGCRFDDPLAVLAETPDLDIAKVQFQYRQSAGTEWIDLGKALHARPFTVSFDPALLGLGYGNYQVRAVAVDLAGNTDPAPSEITVTYADVTPPAMPSNVSARVDGGDVTLSWTAVSDDDVAGYNVYRYNFGTFVKLNQSAVTDTVFTVHDLDDGSYLYSVTAVDAGGNESGYTESVEADVYTPGLEQPFTPTAEESIHITGYSLNRGDSVEVTLNGTLVATITSDLSKRFGYDLTLVPGENSIMVKTVDSAGNRSKPSPAVFVYYDQAPEPPTGLFASATDTACALAWDPNTEPNIFGYNVYRGAVKLNQGSFVESAAASASSYSGYAAKAFDNDPSTDWHATFYPRQDEGVWWQLTLASRALISRMEIDWASPQYSGKDFDVQVWSGHGWLSYRRVRNNTSPATVVDFDKPYGTDRLRILVTDSNGIGPYDTYQRRVAIAEVRAVQENPLPATSWQDSDLSSGEYSYRVSAVDINGFESPPCDQVSVAVGDFTPPAPPQGLVASESNGTVTLNWSAGTEPDLAGYNVYFLYDTLSPEWQLGKSVPAGQSTCTFQGLCMQNGVWSFRVTALDTSGNESEPSGESAVTITSGPLPPQNLSAAVSGFDVQLGWSPGGDTDVAGYIVFTETEHGWERISQEPAAATTCTVRDMAEGTYSFMVVAVNSAGYMSEPSGIVTVEVGGSSTVLSIVPPPVITDPSPLLSPIRTGMDVTDISGTIEPGLNAWLYRNGVYVDSVAAVETAPVEVPLGAADVYIEQIGASPDGRRVAYAAYMDDMAEDPTLVIVDIETGETTQVAEGVYSFEWAPHTNRIAYLKITFSPDDQMELKCFIYDGMTGIIAPLTDDPDGMGEWDPSWSSDESSMVFVRRDGEDAPADIWIKDLNSGGLTQVTHYSSTEAPWIFSPKLSPDGRYVAYSLEYETPDDFVAELRVLDIETGDEAVVAGGNTDVPYFDFYDWSPKEDMLAFTAYSDASPDRSNTNIYIYDVKAGELTRVTSAQNENGTKCFDWQPDGASILYADTGYYSTGSGWDDRVDFVDFREASVVSPGEERMVAHRENMYLYNLAVSDTGEIWYSCASPSAPSTIRNLPRGEFRFDGVNLEPGENEFSVVAVDGDGNRSDFSRPLTLILDQVPGLADLVVSGADIFIQPLSPLNGEKVTGSVIARNTGTVGAENVDIRIYVVNPSGEMEPVRSEIIDYMAPGDSARIDFSWSSAGRTGNNTILVDVDPQGSVDEADEWNNTATRRFTVVDEYGIAMSTELNTDVYDLGEFVRIFVDISNSDADVAADLDVRIEDANGAVVDVVDAVALDMPYGYSETQFMIWPAIDIYAGDYTVVATLSDDSGIIEENIVPFTVLPVIGVSASVSTNKTGYDTNEDVLLDIKATNTGQSGIPFFSTRVTVKDPNGDEVYTKEWPVANLPAGVSVSLDALWNTGAGLPGVYTAVVETYLDGDVVASGTKQFVVNAVPVIEGGVDIDPVYVIPGNEVTAGFSITNSGNADVAGLPVSVVVYDPESGDVVHAVTQTVDISAGEKFEGSVPVSTDGYGLKTYTVMLQTQISGAIKTLDSKSLTVADGTPPVVSVISPRDGSACTSSFYLTVDVNDRFSGISSVEYSIDDGTWLPIPLMDPSIGRYSKQFVPTEADEGMHTIRFRATDLRRNMSNPVPVNITIAPGANIAATLNADRFGMNGDVVVSIDAANIGWAKELTIGAVIETPEGATVAALDPVTGMFGRNETKAYSLTWNTGNARAGDYNVRAFVKRGDTVLDEALVTFTITPVLNISAVVTSDRSDYEMNEDAQVEARIANLGNYTVQSLAATIRIVDASDNELFEVVNRIDNLDPAPSQPLPLKVTWNTGSEPAGDYRVIVAIAVGNETIVENMSRFTINPSVIINGAITASPANVPIGDTVTADYTVTNNGNVALSSMPVSVSVIDPDSGETLKTGEQVIGLAIGESHTGQVAFDTGDLGLKTYRVSFKYFSGAGAVELAAGAFTVIDTVPPVVAIISPADSSVFHSAFDLIADATDNASGVAGVECKIDDNAWRPLPVSDPATGRYTDTFTPTEADEGPHTVSFRASDLSGNVSEPVFAKIFLVPEAHVVSSLNATEFGMNSDVVAGVNLANTGWAKHVTVEAVIENADGDPVATLAPVDTTLAYDGTTSVDLTWDTGSTYAGDYRVRTMVKKGDAVLDEAAAPFTIIPVLNVSVTAGTDRTDYGMNADVVANARVTSHGNYTVDAVNVKMRILNSAGEERFCSEHTVTGLDCAETVPLSSAWNTGAEPAGEYQVLVEAYVNNEKVAEQAASFIVDAVEVIAGALSVTPAEVPMGDTVQADYAITNSGNVAMTAMTVTAEVIDPGTTTVVKTETTGTDLAIGADKSGQFLFATGDLELKTYTVRLTYTSGTKATELATTTFTVIDVVPPAVTITSPGSNTSHDGPFSISAHVTDNASGVAGVEYRMDSGSWQTLPLTDPASGTYSTLFTPTDADEGAHVIFFRAQDHAGNMSTPVSVPITIELFKAFKELTGTLDAMPVPVLRGVRETFVYSIVNGHPDDINGLTITVAVIDPDNDEIKLTVDRTINMQGNTVIADDFKDIVDLEPKTYKAALIVSIDAPTPARELATASFEVIPRPDIHMDKTVSSGDIRLLVWINDNCHIQCNGMPLVFDSTDRGGSLEGKGIGCLTDCEWKGCIRVDLLEQVLKDAVSDYRLTYDKQEFADQLRNPYYTDILILGNHQSLGCNTLTELMERVNTGMGVVASLWYQHTLEPGPPFLSSMFGVSWNGLPMICGYDVSTVESPITAEGIIDAVGEARRVKEERGTTIAGWLDPGRPFGWPMFNIKYPAIVLNEYGKGKTVYYAFDLGLTLNDGNYDRIGGLIADSVTYVHDDRAPDRFLPWQMVPVNLTIESSDGDFDYRLTETFPEGLTLYDHESGEWITDSPWQLDVSLETGEPVTIRFSYLVPDAAGTYATTTELGMIFNDDYIELSGAGLDLTINKDTSTLFNEAISDIRGLSVPWWKRFAVRNMVRRLESVRDRAINSRNDIEHNISDIISAIHSLMMLEHYADIDGIRFKLDDLLYTEQRIYFLCE